MLSIDPKVPLIEEPAAEDENPQLEGQEEQGVLVNDNEEVRDEKHDEDNEGLIFAHEDNVVSDDETFM